jgi:hypothetical protein
MVRLKLREVLMVLTALPVSVVLTLPITWRHLYYQAIIGTPLRRELGFSDGSPFTQDPQYWLGREVVSVTAVVPGGVAASAGLRPGDVFVDYCRPDRGTTALFRDLEAARGKKLCLDVVRIEGSDPLERRTRRSVCLDVLAR